jgi:hypothetical protein
LIPLYCTGCPWTQAADRLVEHHFVILELGVDAGLGQPQAEQQGAATTITVNRPINMMGSGFHVRPR